MKTFSFFKLICMLVCSFALFVACSSGASENGVSTGNFGGGSSEDPNDYGIIKDYDPYISPTKRHIIATEYLNCIQDSIYSTKYFITESGEVYSDYTFDFHRLNVFDKSNNKVTDEVKIVSGECIKGSSNAILKSKEGKYYITNYTKDTSKELTFYKDKATPYEATDEIKFGNVEYFSRYGYAYYASLKDGVIHYWNTSGESKPIKVSGSNSFSQMYIKESSLFAIKSDGTLYKLNHDNMQMEEFTEIYHKTGSSYDITYSSYFTQSSNIKFKAIYSNGTFLSTDNKLYQYKSRTEKVYKIAAKNSDSSYNDDLTLTEVFEKGTVYYVNSDGAIKNDSALLGKDSAGNYYNLSNDIDNAYVYQVTNPSFIIDSSDIIFHYYDSSSDFQTFFKTSDGLKVRGKNQYGQLGIGRDDNGIISTTNGERKKVLFPESDGNIDVKKMWTGGYTHYAQTDKGFYAWGMNSTGADNLAMPEKVMAYKITGFPSGMGTVSGTYDCDLTLTATEASNLNIKETSGNFFITEDGRAFQKYSGNLYFDKKVEWRYTYKCASEGVIANSFVQLDLGEGVVAKGFLDGERVMTNIGILKIYDFYTSSYKNYYRKWAETQGTIVE